jgi:hypothetical protein
MIPGNSTPLSNDCNSTLSILCLPCIFPAIYFCTRRVFEVEANHFALVINESVLGKRTLIYGPGYHKIGYYNKL